MYAFVCVDVRLYVCEGDGEEDGAIERRRRRAAAAAVVAAVASAAAAATYSANASVLSCVCALKLRGNISTQKPGMFSGSSSIPPSLTTSRISSMSPSMVASNSPSLRPR